MSDTGKPLTRDLMAARVAAEFQDEWVVNLGVGMPTRCSDFVPEDRTVILHSENGVIGYGRNATVEEATPYVVNGGAQPVLLTPLASIVHHADAFAIIRRGLLDVAVLGRLRGSRQRGLRELAHQRPQGRGHRRGDGTWPWAPSRCSCCSTTPHATAVPGCSSAAPCR